MQLSKYGNKYVIGESYNFKARQRSRTAITDTPANPQTIQKALGCSPIGNLTFIEKIETTKLGTIIAMVIILRILINMFKLLLTIDALASIKLARMSE